MNNTSETIEFFQAVLDFWKLQESAYKRKWDIATKAKCPKTQEIYFLYNQSKDRVKRYKKIIADKRAKSGFPNTLCSQDLLGLYNNLPESKRYDLEKSVLDDLRKFGLLPFQYFLPSNEESSLSFFNFYYRAILKILIDKGQIKETFVDGIQCFSLKK